MIYEQIFKKFGRKGIVKAGVIGSGHFGTAVVTQSITNPLLDIPVIADTNINATKLAFKRAGIHEQDIIICYNRESAMSAIEAHKRIVLEDALIMMTLPIDVVVECTGIPEAGAKHAYEAIQSGKHVVMINKETDSALGPILKVLADKAGVVYTPVDGDQHGLLIGLVNWAKTLGLEVVCAGKSVDSELVYDFDKRTVIGKSHEGPRKTVELSKHDMEFLKQVPKSNISDFIINRKRVLKDLVQGQAYDLCELAITVNATGLLPDKPELHSPVLRTSEIPSVLCADDQGGILHKRGSIDLVTYMGDINDAGLGGGVFVVVSCENDYSREILTTKGLLSNRDKTASLIYRPYHLCGVETSISILCAALLGIPTGNDTIFPYCDIVKASTRKMNKGEVLGGDHDSSLKALILPSKKLSAENPLPAHLLYGNKLKYDIPAGTLITCDMVEVPVDSLLWTLRNQQDKYFL